VSWLLENSCTNFIPSPNHGEIYDPSHDVWQHTESHICPFSIANRLKRIHVQIKQEIFLILTGGICLPYAGKFVREWVEKTGISFQQTVLGIDPLRGYTSRLWVGEFYGLEVICITLKENGFTGTIRNREEAALLKANLENGSISKGCKAAVQKKSRFHYFNELGDEGLAYPKAEISNKLFGFESSRIFPLVTMDYLLSQIKNSYLRKAQNTFLRE